ncbi:hypothetical protein AAG593_06625 [Citromicrobium bathyomarinum]|uniref:hypothetical protein n=1 Tax=Alteriqipengyuania lutimaris TaxID=1538146 RepID=UPI001CFE8A4F|nr:hypothetical protein [Alteriqipengyuania lutimaris]
MADASTPQFRTKLIRALKNAYPGREFEIVDQAYGLSVRLKDSDGMPIGREAKFRGNRVVDLSKSVLVGQFGIEPGKP